MDRGGRGKGRWRREREMEKTEREHGELNRKERKGESSPDPEKREIRKGGIKGARGSQGWERSKKPSLSRLQETLSGSD